VANENNAAAPANANHAAPGKVQPEKPEDSPLGVYASFDYSPEPFADLTEEAKNTLMQLDMIAAKTDVAARRLEVEQAWEAIHFDRGYQHLLRGKQGGWILPGQSTGYGVSQQFSNNGIYDTNIYGPKGDIIVAALSREVPKVEFFPSNPDYGPDIIAAEEADNFKMIWARNNNLHQLLVDTARIFWNEDRVLMWTRYELNGQEYGFEEDEPAADVPENHLNPPPDTPTGQDTLDDILSQEDSLVSTTEVDVNAEIGPEGMEVSASVVKKPLGREVTSVHGKLDHKTPIAVDKQKDMQFIQLFEDVDVVIAKAKFPWIADKIRPGGDKLSESELDRIARENTRQAVLGAYVTGDSFARHVTIKHTWFRPSMFMDEQVGDAVRAELFEKFPNGCVLVKAGAEYAFSRNESMDDHVCIGHPWSGKGQNRRSMGDALIAIQKRINDWVDLLDDFFKRTVPKKWYNNEAFDMEAMKRSPNVPGTSGPFQVQPGLTAREQYMFVEETPQPQAALADFIKWFISGLSEEISGALPSLFGAATGEETVGNAVIQRDQALQRVGCPWNSVQDLFAEAARQAVKCAAECRAGKKVTQNIPMGGNTGETKNISVNTANLQRGNVLCYAESNPAFPESWQQKEAKLMTMIEGALNSPEMAKWLFSSQNLPILADGIRMKQFKVPGATSVTKQKYEFEVLLRSGPVDNPQVLQAMASLDQARQGHQQALQAAQVSGQPLPPEIAQAEPQMQQLQQVIQSMPQQVSTITVAQDESENHAVEADTCFEWMNSSEGQKFKSGTPMQKEAFENVHLHWKEHLDMAKKIAAANAPPVGKPPSESISAAVDKMPAPVAIQLLAKMGVDSTPDMFAQHSKDQLNDAIAKKTIPDAIKGKKEQAPKLPQPPPQGS
jgi:hypothetical protein